MINFYEACTAAKQYFKEKLNIDGLAKATENDTAWFFRGGDPQLTPIGSVIVSVSKQDGAIDLVDVLTKEEFEMIRKTTIVAVPQEFMGS